MNANEGPGMWTNPGFISRVALCTDVCSRSNIEQPLIHSLGYSMFQHLYTVVSFCSCELPYIMFHNKLSSDSVPEYEDIAK